MRRICWWFAATAMLIALTACPASGQNEATEVGNGDSAGKPNSTMVQTGNAAAPPAGAVQQWLKTSDGYNVSAWYWAPTGKESPGVILLHMRGSDKSSYATLGSKLVDEGFAAIAIDLRGHGESTDPAGKPVELNSLKDSDYLAMLSDVKAAHDFMAGVKNVDGERVGIIGASIGANLGIMYAAGDRRVRTVVALSPGLDYKGLKPLDYLDRYGARALYLIVASGDQYSYSSCQQFQESATKSDPLSLRVFDGNDHGTNLIAVHDGLDMTIITGWLLNHLPPSR